MPISPIGFSQRRLSDYGASVGADLLAHLRRQARPLAGLRVLHLSAGPFGSAVAETLAALVPLQRDLGLLADWLLLRSDAPEVWTALYRGLGGQPVAWGRGHGAAWHAYAKRHATLVSPDYDVIVAHDPQAIALARELPASGPRPRWVWHCHLDVRAARPEVWAEVKHALQPFAAVLFPAAELIADDVPVAYRGVAHPALDPCSPRNAPLSPGLVDLLLRRLGLDPARPIVGQFAPIDRRYAPMAALGAYWLASRELPGLQIALVDTSLLASDPPRPDLARVLRAAAGDPNVRVFAPEDGLGATEVNALQRGVSVALEMAVPTGFGWGLAECQWKGKPAVAGRHGDLPRQVEEGQAGVIAQGAPDAAEAVVGLLREPGAAGCLGRRGQERIRSGYLITRLLADYLDLFHRLTSHEVAAPAGNWWLSGGTTYHAETR